MTILVVGLCVFGLLSFWALVLIGRSADARSAAAWQERHLP